MVMVIGDGDKCGYVRAAVARAGGTGAGRARRRSVEGSGAAHSGLSVL